MTLLDIVSAGLAIGFCLFALAHNAVGGVGMALTLVFVTAARLAIGTTRSGNEEATESGTDTPETRDELIAHLLAGMAVRHEIAEARLRIGIEHGKANTRVILIEEELILRYGGQQFVLADGRVVTIGLPGCHIADRVRVSSSVGAAIAAVREDGIF